MLLRRITRPQAISRNCKQVISTSHHQRRSIYEVPPLGGQNNEKAPIFAQHGVPGFLTPRTFQQTWQEYQKELVEKMNAKTADTEYESKGAYQLHLEFSRKPEHADFYNTTAMAHFNHLWWDSLAPEKKAVPDLLRRDLEEDFQSMDHLRAEMLEHGDAIFGNGFVWLMKEKSRSGGTNPTAHQKMRILCTYNAGSPYDEAWRMRQSRESSTMLDRASQQRSQMSQVQNTVGTFGPNSRQARDGYGPRNTLHAIPLLCLNVWQHMWVPDYGILGKKQYLAAWWERIDWDVVAQRHQAVARTSFAR